MNGIISPPRIDNSPIERKASFTESRLLTADSQNIPFKRESGDKDIRMTENSRISGFQFPSNGKEYTKQAHGHTYRMKIMSFHSLQTGKNIQRASESV